MRGVGRPKNKWFEVKGSDMNTTVSQVRLGG